jgi:hypothetical protein
MRRRLVVHQQDVAIIIWQWWQSRQIPMLAFAQAPAAAPPPPPPKKAADLSVSTGSCVGSLTEWPILHHQALLCLQTLSAEELEELKQEIVNEAVAKIAGEVGLSASSATDQGFRA